jgi:hypothetical protein
MIDRFVLVLHDSSKLVINSKRLFLAYLCPDAPVNSADAGTHAPVIFKDESIYVRITKRLIGCFRYLLNVNTHTLPTL